MKTYTIKVGPVEMVFPDTKSDFNKLVNTSLFYYELVLHAPFSEAQYILGTYKIMEVCVDCNESFDASDTSHDSCWYCHDDKTTRPNKKQIGYL